MDVSILHRYPTSGSDKLQLGESNTAPDRLMTFQNRSIIMWNDLSDELKELKSYHVFKRVKIISAEETGNCGWNLS